MFCRIEDPPFISSSLASLFSIMWLNRRGGRRGLDGALGGFATLLRGDLRRQDSVRDVNSFNSSASIALIESQQPAHLLTVPRVVHQTTALTDLDVGIQERSLCSPPAVIVERQQRINCLPSSTRARRDSCCSP